MTPFLWLLLAATTPDPWTWWIQPCTKELATESACEAGDAELAEWALAAWQSASDGKLRFTRATAEEKARLRFYWATGAAGLYGETRPLRVGGQTGAAIYVLPDLAQLGPEIAAAGKQDRLFRHTVVYLTFLHESGHALGHPHTSDFDSIMYSFGYGGDILEYFARYRRKLGAREDISRNAGIRLGAREK
jgi:Matrixin